MTPEWEEPVERDFFAGTTLEVAPRLLGSVLCHRTGDVTTAGRIVEVEAYLGARDRAAHSYSGEPTARTRAMFGQAGHLYVYLIYGMHYCCNVVTAQEGTGEAVLIRGLEPLQGEEAMHRRRQLSAGRASTALTNGPGKLCEAMAITDEHYGTDLTRPPLSISRGDAPPPENAIQRGPRIGIENTGGARHYPYRFWIRDNPYVSS